MEKWSLVRTCVVLGCLRIALGTIIDPERDTEQTSGLLDRVFAEVDIPPDCSASLTSRVSFCVNHRGGDFYFWQPKASELLCGVWYKLLFLSEPQFLHRPHEELGWLKSIQAPRPRLWCFVVLYNAPGHLPCRGRKAV